MAEKHRKEFSHYERLREKVSDVTARLSNMRTTFATSNDNSSVEAELRQLLALPDCPLADLLESARKKLAEERIQLDRLHRLLSSSQRIRELREVANSKELLAKKLRCKAT